MTFKTLAAAGTAVALALTSAPAFAQAPAPATTAAPAVTHGAAVPGMCVISVEAAIGDPARWLAEAGRAAARSVR